MSRWDRWEQAIRRTTLADQLMSEVAKVLWEDLGHWPPPIEEVEAAGQRQYAELLSPGSPVPPRAAYTEGIRLAGWDLQREFEAFDDYVRNRRWTEAGLSDTDKTAILFLASYMTESLLQLMDATAGRVKRKDLLVALERLKKRYELAT